MDSKWLLAFAMAFCSIGIGVSSLATVLSGTEPTLEKIAFNTEMISNELHMYNIDHEECEQARTNDQNDKITKVIKERE